LVRAQKSTRRPESLYLLRHRVKKKKRNAERVGHFPLPRRWGRKGGEERISRYPEGGKREGEDGSSLLERERRKMLSVSSPEERRDISALPVTHFSREETFASRMTERNSRVKKKRGKQCPTINWEND